MTKRARLEHETKGDRIRDSWTSDVAIVQQITAFLRSNDDYNDT